MPGTPRTDSGISTGSISDILRSARIESGRSKPNVTVTHKLLKPGRKPDPMQASSQVSFSKTSKAATLEEINAHLLENKRVTDAKHAALLESMRKEASAKNEA